MILRGRRLSSGYTERGTYHVTGVCRICGSHTREVTSRRGWPEPAPHCDACIATYRGALSFPAPEVGALSLVEPQRLSPSLDERGAGCERCGHTGISFSGMWPCFYCDERLSGVARAVGAERRKLAVEMRAARPA